MCDSVLNFFFASGIYRNPRVPCESLPTLDLEMWKDRVDCTVKGINIKVGNSSRVSPCTMCTCTKEGVSVQTDEHYVNCLFIEKKSLL